LHAGRIGRHGPGFGNFFNQQGVDPMMSRPLFKLLLANLLAATSALASAQALDPTSVVNAGAQVTKLIDEGRYGEIWDAASTVTKKVVQKASFIEMTAKLHAAVGAAPAAAGAPKRVWYEVSRHDEAGSATVPAGVYLNLLYHTGLANGREALELITFRFDEDMTWRFAGYVIK
jgi:Protein of unknown function (DUF4019)